MLYLLVGIDTESDNQWDKTARARPTFENIYALTQLHERFRRHGVRPTYLITHPVATEARSSAVIHTLSETGECEIGAHHHAWETPPCSPEDLDRHPYALALPREQFEAQLNELTQAIGRAAGAPPRSYRSGRFGFSAAHVSSLERAGYLVESSVAPLFFEAHKKGPDFVDAPLAPYFLAYDDACRPGASDLLELPISAQLNRRVPSVVERMFARAPRPYMTKRLLRAAGVADVVWLRPSYSTIDDMRRLARRIAGDGIPLLNVIFHSSEALAGASPYNRTPGDLDGFFDRLDKLLLFATRELGAVPATFREFRARFCGHAHATSQLVTV